MECNTLACLCEWIAISGCPESGLLFLSWASFPLCCWKLVQRFSLGERRKAVIERVSEPPVLIVIHPPSPPNPCFFPPRLTHSRSASWFCSLPSPIRGMLISRKLLYIYKGEFGSSSLKRQTPKSLYQNGLSGCENRAAAAGRGYFWT